MMWRVWLFAQDASVGVQSVTTTSACSTATACFGVSATSARCLIKLFSTSSGGSTQQGSNKFGTYNHKEIETQWHNVWNKAKRTQHEKKSDMPPFYALSMFPYPSGNLHMGHVRVYTISDAISRIQRMRGFDVIHPMGWDAFGLPAENAAIERGIQPHDWTYKNIEQMRGQLQSLGIQFDWHREITTCDPSYYRWTQWLFLQLFKHGLAYQADAEVNWDPVDQTVLANEQVDANGRSWRSGAIVEKRKLRQWFLKITEFGDALADRLEELDGWPAQVKLMQKQWIGRSKGVMVKFDVFSLSSSSRDTLHQTPFQDTIEVFTTRLDTLFGVTYVALAPEHPVLEKWLRSGIISQQQSRDVRQYIQSVSATTAAEREKEGMSDTPTGVALGIHARHPLTGDVVPVYVADYVITTYGSGAVMGVPAHDERDYRFAMAFDLPVKHVIVSSGVVDSAQQEQQQISTQQEHEPSQDDHPQPFTQDGVLHDSQQFSGQHSSEARDNILHWLQHRNLARPLTTFRLRDWLVSRQRFWGAPIPIIHCESCGVVPVPEDQLPVHLPSNLTLHGRGGSPLMSAQASQWRSVPCPRCHRPAQRDTDTLDTFVDSSWYFLRYLSPHRNDVPFDVEQTKRFFPVNIYVGGIEHAILHLLYARFITAFLHRCKLVSHPEPFQNLITQGMVHGETFREPTTGRYVLPSHVECLSSDGTVVERATGKPLVVSWEKMSKSKYNGIEPGDMVEQYGADTTRLFILFKAPVEKVLDWDARAVAGQSRWLVRVWSLVQAHCNVFPLTQSPSSLSVTLSEFEKLSDVEKQIVRETHTTIHEVTKAIDDRVFNVAVSHLMKLSNTLSAVGISEESTTASAALSLPVFHQALKTLSVLLSPLAPHISAELWLRLCGGVSAAKLIDNLPPHLDVHVQPWPNANQAFLIADQMSLVIQIKGKTRGSVPISLSKLAGLTDDTPEYAQMIEQLARTSDVFLKRMSRNHKFKKVVVVPPSKTKTSCVLVNFV